MPAKRAKSLKSMTVSELVKERKKHSDKINQIDEILKKASEALGQKVVEQQPATFNSRPLNEGNYSLQPGSIGATPIRNPSMDSRKFSQTAPISLSPPTVQPIGHGTKENIAPVFSLFDADADARLRASAEALSEEHESLDYSPSDIDTSQLKEETANLKEQLSKELNNINDIPVPTPIEGESTNS